MQDMPFDVNRWRPKPHKNLKINFRTNACPRSKEVHTNIHNISMFQCIYHNTELLNAIYVSKILDVESFINLKLKNTPEQVRDNFNHFKDNNKTSAEYLRQFIYENFENGGVEYDNLTPTDWKIEPLIIRNIKDKTLKEMALLINDQWKLLVCKFKLRAISDKDKYSSLYLNQSVILPSTRFHTYRYWETYWVILGLLLCQMEQTARDMLENFVDLIDKHGLVPLSGRIYMLGRSQSPLFIPMVYEYYKVTKDLEFVRKNMPIMAKEIEYWVNTHSKFIPKFNRRFYFYICDQNEQGESLLEVISNTSS